jgi:hypothetical protein
LITQNDPYEERMNYSVANNVLTLTPRYYEDGAIIFNGNSETLIGTWTRNKNKEEACREHEYYGYSDYYCDEGYDITKVVVTPNNQITVTTDYCMTDRGQIGEEWEKNWPITKILDCNSFEVQKGNDKIKIYIDESSYKFTYNGKTCQVKETTVSERKSACNKAIADVKAGKCGDEGDDCLEKFYYKHREDSDNDFKNCVINNKFPLDFFGDDDDDDDGDYESSLKKTALGKILGKKNLQRK